MLPLSVHVCIIVWLLSSLWLHAAPTHDVSVPCLYALSQN
jgi:hypothetical protein